MFDIHQRRASESEFKRAEATRVFKYSDFQQWSSPQEPTSQMDVAANKGPVTQEPTFQRSGAEKDLNADISPKFDKKLTLFKKDKFQHQAHCLRTHATKG